MEVRLSIESSTRVFRQLSGPGYTTVVVELSLTCTRKKKKMELSIAVNFFFRLLLKKLVSFIT